MCSVQMVVLMPDLQRQGWCCGPATGLRPFQCTLPFHHSHDQREIPLEIPHTCQATRMHITPAAAHTQKSCQQQSTPPPYYKLPHNFYTLLTNAHPM